MHLALHQKNRTFGALLSSFVGSYLGVIRQSPFGKSSLAVLCFHGAFHVSHLEQDGGEGKGAHVFPNVTTLTRFESVGGMLKRKCWAIQMSFRDDRRALNHNARKARPEYVPKWCC